MALFLLLSLAIETRIGSKKLRYLILAVSLLTAFINEVFFDTPLLGASGVVFGLIMLTAAVDLQKGVIPIALLAVAGVYFGREVVSSMTADRIAQFAHVAGGVVGLVFTYWTSPASNLAGFPAKSRHVRGAVSGMLSD